ncbi:VapE domain-containing protein [uncultured Paraglaciecola sp.]|uniref:VapE domain-containing protein n=1 Tax=uncultured Paraglaciecola sp. TaxID=1765024 RepID=UPI00260622DE|nr:VapE domain-containing protein [uncultured Paraglaciecola sp.]
MTDINDAIQSALEQLVSFGLQVNDLNVDGKLCRVRSEGDKGSKKSGWYVAHEFNLDDGRSVITGRFGNWKGSGRTHEFKFDATFTPEQKAELAKQRENQRAAAAKEKKARHKQAVARAAKSWPGLSVDGKSEYLTRKKIHHCGARFARGSVIVPLYKNKILTGLQWIAEDGSKKFITGTEKEGAYFYIKGTTDRQVVCEGYATGCSISMSTGHSVLVAFDSGNLPLVVDGLIAAGTDPSSIIVAADNDWELAIKRPDIGNAGLKAAGKVSAKYSSVWVVYPAFSDGAINCSDFNDLHVMQGLDAVRDAFNNAQAPEALGEIYLPEYPIDSENVLPDELAAPPFNEDWHHAFVTSKSGARVPSAANVLLALENDPTWAGRLAYCDFSYKLIKRESPLPDMLAGEWEDADTARLRIWLSNTWCFEPSRQNIADALVTVAQRNRFHPVRDYLNGLEWDSVPRIDKWLEDVYESSTDASYLSLVGKYFLIGSVARIMRPGCKMDNVMILEGRQGLRKSTSVATLFGDWFSDAPIPIGEKDAYQNIQGVWCSELAELDSFNKAESNSAKMFFSQVRDRYRPSYGHCAQDFKRQCVFIGTTNQSEYLKDYSGNRRYWPVKCLSADIELLKTNRDQYWAEAVSRFKAGEQWWPDDAAADVFDTVQDERMQLDPWQISIEDYLHKTTREYVQADDVLVDAIKKDMAQVTRADQNRVSPIMKSLGWRNERKRIRLSGSDKKVQRHVYLNPNFRGIAA